MKSFTTNVCIAAAFGFVLATPVVAQDTGSSTSARTGAVDTQTSGTNSTRGEVSSTPETRRQGNKNNMSQDGTSSIGGGSQHGPQSTQAQGMGAAGTGLGGTKSSGN
jgi:hypothetical protein